MWTQQDVSQEARTLFELGNQLYERLGSLATHADDLRRAIERTVDSYNRFAGSLESRVLVSARKFPGIDATKLDALGQPAPIEKTPRRLTAPELLEETLDLLDDPDAVEVTAVAELGDVRERISSEEITARLAARPED
jgi:DNA recombination protein RmuC